MSSREQSLESLRDDGAGQIPCPKKGLMAIQRCREWQRDTEQEGHACTCPVYLNYGKSEPRGAGEMSPERQLCGSQFDVAADQLRSRMKHDSRQPRDATEADATEADATEADATEADATEADATEADATEEATMATKPKRGMNCDGCGKPAPDGTKIRDGLCKPCRDKKRAANDQAESDRAARIRAQHEAASAPAKAPTKPLATERQPAFGPVLEQENARLLKELERARRDLSLVDFVHWALDGHARGFIKDLAKALTEKFKPRFKGADAIASFSEAAKD